MKSLSLSLALAPLILAPGPAHAAVREVKMLNRGAGGAMVMKVKVLQQAGKSPEAFQAHPGQEKQQPG